jgi:radical SAM superfamily enzyme YgiQ (UPF0313 family)
MSATLDATKKRQRFRLIIPRYPTFNIYSHIAKRTTALGPVCVASSINEMPGWDVEIIDENNYRRYGPKTESGAVDYTALEALRPCDVVGVYGGLTSTIPRLFEIAQFYHDRNIPVIAGGQHFSSETIPEAFQHCIDYIVLGEGEKTVPELLNAFLGKGDIKKVRGVAFREKERIVCTHSRELLTDFDALPIPDFSLVRHAIIDLYPVGRIRGCGMDCEFCTVKGKARCASPSRFLESIRTLVETYNAKHFFVVDDLFGQDRLETLHVCYLLSEYQKSIGRRLNLTVQIRLDKAKDTELLSAMRKAGINTVAIGFESPIAEELKAMNKRIKPEEMIELALLYHKAGFLVHGMFIFGYPLQSGATFTMPIQKRVKHFKEFIKRAKIDTVQVLLPVPLPGTELRERLVRENRIYATRDIGFEYYDGNFPLFEPDPPLTAEALQSGSRKIMSKMYRVHSMFMVGVRIIYFPALLFYIYNLKRGWRRWSRAWRNDLTRFGGWFILRGWTEEFKKGVFLKKLHTAQDHKIKV